LHTHTEINNQNSGRKHIGIAMDKLSRIKLRHFETFMEVARHGSVSRAAESLHLTQPAVTRTIRELETICGKPLIEREGRGIRITPHGEIFLRYAGRSLSAARGGIAALEQLGLSETAPIRIGALPTVSATVMPEAVAAYLATGTRNRLGVVTGENRVLLDQLRNGDLELVIGRLPAPENMQGLVFEPLYRDKVVFVVASSHPLAGRRQIAIDDMSAFPVMVPTSGSIIRPFVDRLFIEQGFPWPRHALETVSDSFGRAFVRRHQAVWIISRGVVASEIESGEFSVLPIDTDATMGSVGLNKRADTDLPPGAEIFADIVRRITVG
jgi:LysR family pca operon transcriptional activator